MLRKLERLLAAAVTTIGIVGAASTAHAEPARAGVDWGKLLGELDKFARKGSEKPSEAAREAARTERAHQLVVQNGGNAWFGVAPRVALVARDWGSAYKIAGDRLSLVDAMRLTASTRMVLSRVRFGDSGLTKVTPFVQIGMGQWRTDPNLLPLTPRSTALASQLGGGIEFQVKRGWQVACETAMTVLVREDRHATIIPAASVWSTMLASRVEF